MPPIDRRNFQKTVTAAAATAGLANARPAAAETKNGPVRLAFVGVANRGMQLVKAFAESDQATTVAVCDVDSQTLAKAAKVIGGDLTLTEDYREVIHRDDVDAVVIATPDHWHAIQCIESCAAGKDVYVEKPLSVTIHEGREMVRAARKYDRVVQVGTHRRSSGIYAELASRVQNGLLGKVCMSRAYRLSNMTPNGIGNLPPSEPPENLNWDLWLGPRAERPYQANIAPYKFRWWQDYSSQMGNWGVHYMDAIRWCTGDEAPRFISAMGGQFAVEDDRTIPDTMEVTFQFPSGRMAVFGMYETSGNPIFPLDGEIEMRGTIGTAYVSEKRYEVIPERRGQFAGKRDMAEPEVREEPGSNHQLTVAHAKNFLECIRTRQRPNADIEIGHRSTTFCHLANISLLLGRRLEWDADAERFVGDDEANAMLHYEYREPWKLPS